MLRPFILPRRGKCVFLQPKKHMIMKRLIATITLILCAAQTLMAQDVIVTLQAERIDAKVMEVSESEIKYKKASNPDGPLFVLSTDKISSILYANGEVQLFGQTQQPKVVVEQPKQIAYNRKIEESTVLFRDRSYIVKNDIGIYEPQNLRELLGEIEYDNYLDAQRTYGRGATELTFGWLDAAVGILMVVLGAEAQNTYVVAGGLVLCIASDILIPVGYIVRGVAAGRISRIAEGYNADARRSLGMDMSLSPSLLVGGNGTVAPGVGVTFRF